MAFNGFLRDRRRGGVPKDVASPVANAVIRR